MCVAIITSSSYDTRVLLGAVQSSIALQTHTHPHSTYTAPTSIYISTQMVSPPLYCLFEFIALRISPDRACDDHDHMLIITMRRWPPFVLNHSLNHMYIRSSTRMHTCILHMHVYVPAPSVCSCCWADRTCAAVDTITIVRSRGGNVRDRSVRIFLDSTVYNSQGYHLNNLTWNKAQCWPCMCVYILSGWPIRYMIGLISASRTSLSSNSATTCSCCSGCIITIRRRNCATNWWWHWWCCCCWWWCSSRRLLFSSFS